MINNERKTEKKSFLLFVNNSYRKTRLRCKSINANSVAPNTLPTGIQGVGSMRSDKATILFLFARLVDRE